MKRLMMLLAAVLPALQPVAAQTPAADTLRRIDPMQSQEVQLIESGEAGTLQLQAGGFGLTLGRSYESKAWEQLNRKRFSLTMLADFEFGFTTLAGVRYDQPAAGQSDFLDQSLANSIHFSFLPVGINYRAGKRRRSDFYLGLHYAVDNIRLSNPAFTVQNAAGLLVPVELDPAARKSKLRYTNLGFVLGYNWYPVKKFRVGVATYYDFLMHARAITKSPKEKPLLNGFNPFRFGVSVKVSYRHIGLFARYTPSSLFKDSSGIEAQTLSYGLCLNF